MSVVTFGGEVLDQPQPQAKRLAIVGDWDNVKWWMDKYISLQIGPEDEDYTRYLFSHFLEWASRQQLTSTNAKEANK